MREGHTLAVVRISVAERKIVLALPIFELFRARSRVAMAAFKVETVSSRPVGRWGSASMAETVGSCKRAVQYRVLWGYRTPSNRDVRSIYHGTSHAGGPVR